jgi:hypothetical protein
LYFYAYLLFDVAMILYLVFCVSVTVGFFEYRKNTGKRYSGSKFLAKYLGLREEM